MVTTVQLSNGAQMPVLGYGVFCIPDDQTKQNVLSALSVGYRHVDTAQIYGNESGVGQAIASCGIPREQLFITSKIWCTNFGYQKAMESIHESLKKLQTDNLDLMLVHRPFKDYVGAYQALVDAQKQGLVRAIGVSNFTEKQIQKVVQATGVIPAVNQIELHPYYPNHKLCSYLKNSGIVTQAWYPLGHGDKKLMAEPILCDLAQKYQKTVVQVLLRWHVQMGFVALPKTTNEEHMRQNLEIFDFELTAEDMQKIATLNKNKPLFNVPDWVQKLSLLFQK